MLVKTDTVQGTGDLGNQSGAEQVQSEFLAGPGSGSVAYPTFRSIQNADLPGGSPARVGTAFLPPIAGIKTYTSTAPGINEGYGGTTLVFSATPTGVTPTATLPVAWNLATAAGANNGEAVGVNNTTAEIGGMGNLKSLKFTIRLTSITTLAMWMGLTDPISNTSIITAFKNNNTPNQNFVGFRFSTKASDPAWMCITQTDSTHQTANTSGVGADTLLHEFEIQYDGTNAVFFADGVQVGSQSGTIPSGSVVFSPFIQMDNVNTAVIRSFDLYSARWIMSL